MEKNEDNPKDIFNLEPFSDKKINEVFSVEQSLDKPIGQNELSQEENEQKIHLNEKFDENMKFEMEY